MENTETQVWLDFSKACGYLNEDKTGVLQEQSEEVGRLLNHMITYPEKYLRKSDKEE
jgi:four helix bundle protein